MYTFTKAVLISAGGPGGHPPGATEIPPREKFLNSTLLRYILKRLLTIFINKKMIKKDTNFNEINVLKNICKHIMKLITF